MLTARLVWISASRKGPNRGWRQRNSGTYLTALEAAQNVQTFLFVVDDIHLMVVVARSDWKSLFHECVK